MASTTTMSVRRPDLIRQRTRKGMLGTQGTRVQVYTNNFQIMTFPKGRWFHYAVEISSSGETADPRFKRDVRNRRVIQHLKLHDPRFREGVYDGKAIFFTTAELGTVLEVPNVFNTERAISAVFTKVQVVDFTILQAFVAGQSDLDDRGQLAVAMLNIFIKEEASQRQDLVANRRAIYSTAHLTPIPGGIQMADGFIQSVRPGSISMVVNVNYTTGLTWRPGPLMDLLKEICMLKGWHFPQCLESNSLQDATRREINKMIKGIKVVTPHLKDRRRPLVIAGLYDQRNDALNYRFDCALGNVSIAEYFQIQYHRPIQRPTLRLVSIRSGNVTLFPIETLTVVPGQLVSNTVKLHPQQVRQIQSVAQGKRPGPRLDSIVRSLRRDGVLAYENAPMLVNSNFRIDTRPVLSDARILPTPTVLYRKAPARINRGAWNMRDLKVDQSCSPITRWALCVLTPRCDHNQAQIFAKTVARVCNSMGISMAADCRFYSGPEPKPLLEACVGGNLVICILDGPNTAQKEQIKQWGDILHGIPTQIVLWDRISDRRGVKSERELDQYCRNLGLKINAKCGGINCVLPRLPLVELGKTVIMGLDVSHPSPGASGPSVAGLASSVDPSCSFYIGQTSLQPPRQESVDNLHELVFVALRQQFMYITKGLKQSWTHIKHLIIFRDGVSEGQFAEVMENEIAQVKWGIDTFIQQYKQNVGVTIPPPKLTFVVVGKNHHFRMFAIQPNSWDPNRPDYGRVGNCESGTVIDSKVTNPYWEDYYLLSHPALLGTSRPAHYSVLLDENSFTADQLQGLSFHLCHLYSRATRAVSIPAPVYYADQICARWRYHFFPLPEDETLTDGSTDIGMDWWKARWRPVHPTAAQRMYWM